MRLSSSEERRPEYCVLHYAVYISQPSSVMSSVGIPTKLQAGQPRDRRSVAGSVQTGSGALPASCMMGVGGCFPESTAVGA